MLPEVASLDDEQLDRVEEAAGALRAIESSGSDGARRLLRHLARRQLIESIATLEPLDAPNTPLLPARRRFLADQYRERRQTVEAVLRHLDARLVMVGAGHLDDLVGSDTPTVFHAMLESADAAAVHSNAGLIRMTEVSFADAIATFTPPQAEMCPSLLAEVVARANAGPRRGDHPIELASWLVVCMILVHPFVDGNGRVARCLFQLVHSAGLPTFDWVSMEQWAADRSSYIAVLAGVASASAGGWYPDRIDVAPFLDFAVARFAAGVDLHQRRTEWCDRAWDAPMLGALGELERFAALIVAVDRSVSRAELATSIGHEYTSEVISTLSHRGLVSWSARGLQPTDALAELRGRPAS